MCQRSPHYRVIQCRSFSNWHGLCCFLVVVKPRTYDVNYLQMKVEMKTHIFIMCSLLGLGANLQGFARDTKSLDAHQASLDQEVATDVGPIMQKLDDNKDGVISRSESVQLEGLGSVFDSVDRNKDGHLDSVELSKFLTPTVR